MEETLVHGLSSLDAGCSIFLKYIGFSFATFAFLSMYATFPKSLFTDIVRIRPSAHLDRLVNESIFGQYDHQQPEKNSMLLKLYEQILSFATEIDHVVFVTLIFILYSILVSTVCLVVNLGVYEALFAGISPRTIFYVVIIMYFLIRLTLDIIFAIRFARNWHTQAICTAIAIIYSIGIFAASLWILSQNKYGILLFISLILFLLLHFIWYIFILGFRNPVHTLVNIWQRIPQRAPRSRS